MSHLSSDTCLTIDNLRDHLADEIDAIVCIIVEVLLIRLVIMLVRVLTLGAQHASDWLLSGASVVISCSAFSSGHSPQHYHNNLSSPVSVPTI